MNVFDRFLIGTAAHQKALGAEDLEFWTVIPATASVSIAVLSTLGFLGLDDTFREIGYKVVVLVIGVPILVVLSIRTRRMRLNRMFTLVRQIGPVGKLRWCALIIHCLAFVEMIVIANYLKSH